MFADFPMISAADPAKKTLRDFPGVPCLSHHNCASFDAIPECIGRQSAFNRPSEFSDIPVCVNRTLVVCCESPENNSILYIDIVSSNTMPSVFDFFHFNPPPLRKSCVVFVVKCIISDAKAFVNVFLHYFYKLISRYFLTFSRLPPAADSRIFHWIKDPDFSLD